ncbi:MAG: PQQ-like beta-propeller repeat protein [Wolbachia endosymbiont of Meromenopon meropis]|nr:PQQ-like beta-propeller repeat protein [Wolbachia endosymbiont of Meromenopon meropis]
MAIERITSLIDKKLSQGYVAPVLTENDIIIATKNGILYSFHANSPKTFKWKLYFPYVKKNSNINMFLYGKIVFFIVDNVLHKIDTETGEILWKKELKAPIRGKAALINNKLAILTIDNYMHVLNVKDGSYAWSYQNDVNVVRGLYSVSPTVSNNKIIAPFSNGELIAFNEDGKKLWNQKLNINLLDTQLTDITNAVVHNTILVATNNSYVYGIDTESGSILWSRPLQVKSVSSVVSYCNFSAHIKEQKVNSGIFFAITKNDKIIGIDVQNGETVWTTESHLTRNAQLFTSIIYSNTLWVMSNNGLMLAFPRFENVGKLFKIPLNVFHTPVFTNDKIYVTTEKNGVFFLKNKFVYYE